MNYKRIYEQIVFNAKNRSLNCYKENHHIIPKCMNGTDNSDNIVALTAKEHFICHKLLCEIYPENNKLKYAYWLMCNVKNKYQHRDYKISSREYEELKLKLSIIRSKEMSGKMGKPHTPEAIEKIKLARSKQVFSDIAKKKMSDSRIGKTGNIGFKHTEESRSKMSDEITKSIGIKCIINGISFDSISKAAKYFNINPNTLRYKLNLTKDKNIQLKDKIKINDLLFDTITEASLFFNIPESTLSYRLKNNIEITTNIKNKKVKCKINGVIYNSIGEAVKLLSIPENTLRYRLNSNSFEEYVIL